MAGAGSEGGGVILVFIGNKFKFIDNLSASMATRLLSDDETVDQYESPTLEHLLNENRMKDLALSKATNLIELLNIELEVERNSHQQSLRQVQTQLAQRYEGEVQRLREKVQAMSRQLGRGVGVSQSTQKTMRHTAFSRASSVRSFENKKKRSVNKKYTENQTVESGKEVQAVAGVSVLNGFCRQQLLELEQWRQGVVEELERLVKEEYDDLAALINAIQACSEDFEAVLEEQPKRQGRNAVVEMGSIIRQQQAVINGWRAYAQELEDMHRSGSFKLQSVCSLDNMEQAEVGRGWVDEVVEKVRVRVQGRRREWEGEVGGLEAENSQLKNILDSMIKLVREEKRLRI